MRLKTSAPSSRLRYVIDLAARDREALDETFAQYAALVAILENVAERHPIRADVVRLQKLAYEQIRARTQLPAQMVLLGIREFAARRSTGETWPGLPLDEKLYAIKGPSTLTVATVRGRISAHYEVAGYRDGWSGAAPARLLPVGTGFEILVGVTPVIRPAEEHTMAYEGILSRVGRLVAGLAHAAVDRAEQKDNVAVVEQAIRDIDREAEEARAALGKSTAEQHRIESRIRELTTELTSLTDRIGTAVQQQRDDLAKAGIERQIDIEAQVAALRIAAADVSERLQEAQRAIEAVIAARREGEARLAELKQSLAREPSDGPNGARSTASPDDRALRSLQAIARVTGVPSLGGASDASRMNELERLHRDRTVEERLAALKAGHIS